VQESQLLQTMIAAEKEKTGGNWDAKLRYYITPAIDGTLAALKSDVEAGLAGSIAMQASGDILGDLLNLGRAALDDGGDPHKNVAAVLVAAAFKDTLRRLAETKAGVTDRPKLEEIVGR
jgi:hypothetical protein